MQDALSRPKSDKMVGIAGLAKARNMQKSTEPQGVPRALGSDHPDDTETDYSQVAQSEVGTDGLVTGEELKR